jgi:phospholipid/cholesterol/gamma-HCH transport system permease protein
MTAPGSAGEVSLPAELADETCRELGRSLRRQRRGARVVLDCRRLAALDSLGAARLLRIISQARNLGLDVWLTGLGAAARSALAELDPAILEDAAPPRARQPLEVVGAHALDMADVISAGASLLRQTWVKLATPFGPRGIKWDRTLQQMSLVGVSGVPIVLFISLLIGVVLALNGADQLRQFGAAIFIANLVAVSMTREMGPLITAVIVSGRTGSAIAAELGTMVISEEVDAMHTMGLNPVRFLVVPKVLALVVMMPLLTVISNVAGVLGGYLVGVVILDLGSDAYLSQTVQSLLITDILTGLVKSVVFGVIIGIVGAQRGLGVRGGPEAVGLATTSAVVASIILCIVANACFTTFFYYAE